MIRKILPGAILTVAVFAVVSLGGSIRAATAGNISPRVLAETANGGGTEALVVLKEQADLSPAANLHNKLEKRRYVVNTLQDVAERTQRPIVSFLRRHKIRYHPFYIVNMIEVTGDRALMLQLAARSDVDRIDANPYARTALPIRTHADSSSRTDSGAHINTVEWNVEQVHAPEVWALGYKGKGLVVASADTGVQWDHPALKLHYRGWKRNKVNHNYNWHDAVANERVPFDPYGYGTFTASEMVGDDGQGNQVGVAPGAKWIACRNMDANGTGSPARYTECFEYLMAPYPYNHPKKGNPALAADSINNSWICPASEGCNWDTLLKIVDAVRAAGIFPAMAAGNSGSNCSTVDTPPAIYRSAVSVGALDSSNNIADFSSRGPVTVDNSNRLKPNLSAPGVNVRGAVPPDQYGYSDGTSMAAPHLAGGVALLWEAKPSLDGDVSQTELFVTHSAYALQTTENCGGTQGKIPNDTYGWGLLDLLKAVNGK